MAKHYDVHLIKIVHVVVKDDTPEPEWAAVDQAAEAVRSDFDMKLRGIAYRDFWVSDKQDVYPVEPCDCGKETDAKE